MDKKTIYIFLFFCFFYLNYSNAQMNMFSSSNNEDYPERINDISFAKKIQAFYSIKRDIVLIKFNDFLEELSKPKPNNVIKNSLVWTENYLKFTFLITDYLGNVIDKNDPNEVEDLIYFLIWMDHVFEEDDRTEIRKLGSVNIFEMKDNKIHPSIKESGKKMARDIFGIAIGVKQAIKNDVEKLLGYSTANDVSTVSQSLKSQKNSEKTKRNISNDPTLKTCPIDRDEGITCGLAYFDLNCDGKIQMNEIEHAREKYPPVWLRFLGGILGALLKPMDKVKKRCDLNGDGEVTLEEWKDPKSQCLDTCDAVKAMMKYFCEPAEKEFKQKLKKDPSYKGICGNIVNGTIAPVFFNPKSH